MPLPTTELTNLIKTLVTYNKEVFDRTIVQMLNSQCISLEQFNTIKFEYGVKDYTVTSALQLELLKYVRLLSREKIPVLINGPSGSGKELIARMLHCSKFGKMITINCSAIPDSLFESELFGHAAGAFTGARTARNGLVEEADGDNETNGGTLFLDEIGDLSLTNQAKLLRLIENGEYRPVGSDKTKIVRNIRYVFATHKNLLNACLGGYFRYDLMYRMGIHIKTHALNDCITCVDDLMPYGCSVELCGRILKLVNGDTKPLFYGNVRQLKAVIEKARILGVESIMVEDIY